jgi:XapX domain-containing protein
VSPLLISLAAGVFIGLIYALLNVRSPAPPAVALVGLLGMIVGSSLGGKLTHPMAAAAPVDKTQHAIAAEKPSHSATLTPKQAG